MSSIATWAALRPLFARWTGVVLPLSAAASVETLLEQRARSLGLSVERLIERLARGLLPGERAVLADALLNHTSWFLREPEGLEHLLDALASLPGAGPRRIWSAGCAGGHEPYTIAMMGAERGLPLTIYATDLASATLARARAARFPASQARNIPPAWRERYVRIRGDNAIIDPSIRSAVAFAEHNLATPPHRPMDQGPFDAVVCRNVLIYFEQTTSLEVLRAFAAAAPHGFILLGAAEQPLVWMTDVMEPDGRAGGQLLVSPRGRGPTRPRRRTSNRAGRTRRAPARPPTGREPPPVVGRVRARELGEHARRAARPKTSGPRPSRPRLVAAPRVPARDASRAPKPPGGSSATQGPRRVRKQIAAEAQVREASTLLRRGQEEEALALLDEVLDDNPMVAVAHVARGLVLKRQGHLRAAAAAFRNARFLTQDGAWMAPYQLGLCLEQLGELPGAREAYRHALDVLEGGGVSGTAGFGGTDLDDGMASTIAASCRARLASL